MIPLIQDAERYRQGMGWTLGSGWCEIACGTCSVCNTARPCEVAANSRAGVRWVPVRRGSAGAKGLKEDYDTGGERAHVASLGAFIPRQGIQDLGTSVFHTLSRTPVAQNNPWLLKDAAVLDRLQW